MRKIKFGIGIFTADKLDRTVEQVQLAEKLGLDSAWLLDSQLVGREVYITMVICAQRTRNIQIASGVTHTYTRHPTVTACAFATLHELISDRFILGIGRGDSAVKALGLSPTPFGQFRREIETIRKLLGGGSVISNGREIQLKFMDRTNPPRIPIYIAAGGPRSLRLAPQIGDGVIIHSGPNLEMIDRSMEIVRQGAAEAGRRLDDLDIVWWTHTSIGSDWKAVKEHIRPKIASKFRQQKAVDLEELGVRLDADARRKAKEAYNFLEHATAGASHGYVADLIPEPIWKELALIGSAEEVGERVKQVLERHPEITSFVINPPVAGFGIGYESILEEFAGKVIPYVVS